MPDISTPNLDYNDMVEAWDINDALMGGTLEMRRQGKTYLPKWPNEDPESYKERIATTLLPAYEEAIKQNIGRVFAEPTVLSEDTPETIRSLRLILIWKETASMYGRSNFSASDSSMVWFMRWWISRKLTRRR
jgi:hypothetical protein